MFLISSILRGEKSIIELITFSYNKNEKKLLIKSVTSTSVKRIQNKKQLMNLFVNFSIKNIVVGQNLSKCSIFLTGMISSFLSWKAWIPLSRLTYGVYLLHILVLTFYYSILENPLHYQDNTFVSVIVVIPYLNTDFIQA